MERLDILNRGAFVEQLTSLVQNISENKASSCFAINGIWGSGKTFVLKMLQEQLEQIQSEETFHDRYFVVEYNCWKRDYYEEPLIAIVADIASAIEEKTKLFPDGETKREFLGALKAVALTLAAIGSAAIREKTGLDIQKCYQSVCDGKKEELSKYENEHKYDLYFGLNKVKEKLAELLKKMANKYTIIFLVDELDRCIPEYAIKILERLHHLTEGQSNIITIIAIDKEQLVTSIKQIFGFENPNKFLEKFIDFEIKLDNGTLSEKICEKYADYIAKFDEDIVHYKEPIEECMQALFSGMDIRLQEHLINRAHITHQLLFSEKKDYSFMCMELLLTIMICVYKDDSCFTDTSVDLTSLDKVFRIAHDNILPSFAWFFTQIFKGVNFTYATRMHSRKERIYKMPDTPNLYGALLYTWYWLHNQHPYCTIQIQESGVYAPIQNNHNELRKFAEAIKMMS